MGTVGPLGKDTTSLGDALANGQSGVRPLENLPTDSLPVKFGGEATDFSGEIDDFGPLEKAQKRAIKRNLKVMCREIKMGVAAAQLSLHDAGLAADQLNSERTGVLYGSDHILAEPEEFKDGYLICHNEQQKFEYDRWADEGFGKIAPLWLLKYLPNMPASHIAIYNDLQGPNNSLTVREASANLAVAEAYAIIRRGHAEMMIAGATGTRLHSQRTMHIVLNEEVADGENDPTTVSRPFDQDRSIHSRGGFRELWRRMRGGRGCGGRLDPR